MAWPNRDVSEALHQARGEMESLLDAVFSGSPWPGRSRGTWSPPTDVYRTPDALVVKVAISGVRREDIEVDYTGRSLQIRGERREQCADSKQGYYLMEIDYGPFFREVVLPPEVEGDGIQATYQDGFLLVRIPLGTPNRQPAQGIPIR